MWTIQQLGEYVERALSRDYEGPASGRVRAVPDARTIRYYTTLGLIDRPAAMRGRTALYGHRHLLQIVAIKRLQAEGLSLADIQRRLTGVGETELAHIARVPPLQPSPETRAAGAAAPQRAAFWKAPAADVAAEPSSDGEPAAAVRAAVELAPGVTVVFGGGRAPGENDAAALARAAEPLIEEMQARGLVGPHY